jgi:hypothetical protein
MVYFIKKMNKKKIILLPIEAGLVPITHSLAIDNSCSRCRMKSSEYYSPEMSIKECYTNRV